MSAYRIYLMQTQHIRAREDFQADDDIEATHVASVLYDACSDMCDSFELWQGTRQIPPHDQKAKLVDLDDARQCEAIEAEERLSESRWRIARSRRLIETVDRLKSARKYE